MGLGQARVGRVCAWRLRTPCAVPPSQPPRLHRPRRPPQNAEGTALGPQDCWLLVRGLKTMALRMERQVSNARRIAEWLAQHPLVQRVNYPGLQGHPGKDVHDRQVSGRQAGGPRGWLRAGGGEGGRERGADLPACPHRAASNSARPLLCPVPARQASSPGSLISFVTGDAAVSRVITERTQLFKITVSFGNVVSLIRWARACAVRLADGSSLHPCCAPTHPPVAPHPHLPTHPHRSMPCFMSHASIPAEVRAARGLPDDLVRISGAWVGGWVGVGWGCAGVGGPRLKCLALAASSVHHIRLAVNPVDASLCLDPVHLIDRSGHRGRGGPAG